MNKATATKTLNKANSLTGPESKGFKRYMALPKKVSFNLMKAHYLQGEPDTTFVSTIRNFFGDMSEQDFKTWLLIN